jgi:hypothetical protein
MSDIFGTFTDPVIYTNADTQQAVSTNNGDSIKHYRIPILYLVIVECKQECHVYANDTKTRLIAHILPNTEGVYSLDSPTDTLVFSWGDINERALPQDTMLFGYVSQAPLDRFVAKNGPLATLFRNANPATVALETVMDMRSAVLGAALALMVESDFIVNDTTLNTFALANAAADTMSPQQLLAVTPYLRNVGYWDGTVTEKRRATYAALGLRTTQLWAAGNDIYLHSWYHPNTATKTARLIAFDIAIGSFDAATTASAHLIYLTSATTPTPGTSITAVKYDQDDPSPEMVNIQNPATVSSVATHGNDVIYTPGITGAAPTLNPPEPWRWQPVLNPPTYPGGRPPTARPGLAEGYAIRLQLVGTGANVSYATRAVWTEE